MRQSRFLLLLAAAACGGGSDGGTTPPAPQPATVTIAPVSGSLESIGDTRQLTATVADASGSPLPNATVTWTTSDQSIVAVNPASGAATTATSRGNGSATVTATAAPAVAQQSFTVAQKMSTLSLGPAQLGVAPGATAQLTASALDARGTAIAGAGANATFSSNNTAAATVSATGLVRGIAEGNATITATLVRDGLTRTATSAVTVATSSGQNFPSTANVAATVNTTFNPADVDIAAGGTVTWTFSTLTHNVTFAAGTFAPPNIPSSTSTSVSRTFTAAGTYTYECTIHPGMTGTVTVH